MSSSEIPQLATVQANAGFLFRLSIINQKAVLAVSGFGTPKWERVQIATLASVTRPDTGAVV